MEGTIASVVSEWVEEAGVHGFDRSGEEILRSRERELRLRFEVHVGDSPS